MPRAIEFQGNWARHATNPKARCPIAELVDEEPRLPTKTLARMMAEAVPFESPA